MDWLKYANPIPAGVQQAFIDVRRGVKRKQQLEKVAREKNESRKETSLLQRLKSGEKTSDKSRKALRQDIDRLEGKNASQFKAVDASIKNLSKSVMRRQAEAAKVQNAIQNGIQAEEEASARIAQAMQAAFNGAIGGGKMAALLNKIAQDGRISASEQAELSSGLANFAIGGFNRLRKELALNDGAITDLEGQLEAISEVLEGIDSNARAISGLATAGTQSGLFDSGDALDNLGNGSFFWRGKRLDLIGLFLSWVSIKGCTLYEKFDREDEDFSDWLMSDKDPAKIVVGERIILTNDVAAVQDKDAETGLAFDAASSTFQRVTPSNGQWPIGCVVNQVSEIQIAPNFNTVLKNAGSFGIFAAGGKWYTTIVPLFSEKLGSLIGLGDGADIVNASE